MSKLKFNIEIEIKWHGYKNKKVEKAVIKQLKQYVKEATENFDYIPIYDIEDKIEDATQKGKVKVYYIKYYSDNHNKYCK